MKSTARKTDAGKYAVAKKLFAILAEHSAEEIETTTDVVRGNEALADVLRRLAAVRRQEESPPPPSTVAPVKGARQVVTEPPMAPGDPWTLRRPSYLTEVDMLDMLRTAMTDPDVPEEALLKLPQLWGAKPARRLEDEKGRPALVLALHTLFEEHYLSPSDRIMHGFETLYELAIRVGRHDSVVQRLRHDIEARLVSNILRYPNLHSLAELRRIWGDGPLAFDPADSRESVAAALVDDLLRSSDGTVAHQAGLLLNLVREAARDAMDSLIARQRRNQLKVLREHED